MSKGEYRWVQKSAIIDIIRTEAQRYGNLSHEQLARISAGSGVSVSTLHEWFFGDTRRPQELSTRFVLQELGVKIIYEREDGTKIRQPGDTMMSQAEQNRILKADREREKVREHKREQEKKKQ